MYVQIQKLVQKNTEALKFIIFFAFQLANVPCNCFPEFIFHQIMIVSHPLFMLIQAVMKKLGGLCLYWIIRILMYCRSTKQ
jgi:hypothetical protein